MADWVPCGAGGLSTAWQEEVDASHGSGWEVLGWAVLLRGGSVCGTGDKGKVLAATWGDRWLTVCRLEQSPGQLWAVPSSSRTGAVRCFGIM